MSKSMKIELKNVKYAAFASQETSCFYATVWIDGVNRGTAENDGHGGATMIHPYQLEQEITAYGATLPPITAVIRPELPEGDPDRTFTYQPDAESIINELLDDFLIQRDLARKLKNRVLYAQPGKRGIYQTKAEGK